MVGAEFRKSSGGHSTSCAARRHPSLCQSPLIAFVNWRNSALCSWHLPVPWSSSRSKLARRRLTSGNETGPKSHTGLPRAASQTTTRPRLRYRPGRDTCSAERGTLKLSSSGGDVHSRLEHAVVGPQPQQDHGELAGHANPRLGRRGSLGQPEAPILQVGGCL